MKKTSLISRLISDSFILHVCNDVHGVYAEPLLGFVYHHLEAIDHLGWFCASSPFYHSLLHTLLQLDSVTKSSYSSTDM